MRAIEGRKSFTPPRRYATFAHSCARSDDILAKVGPYYVHGGLRLNLIPRPDRGRILNIPLVCAPDEAFRLWFETLPDVPWKDPLEPESAP
jgi:hypothetical protein